MPICKNTVNCLRVISIFSLIAQILREESRFIRFEDDTKLEGTASTGQDRTENNWQMKSENKMAKFNKGKLLGSSRIRHERFTPPIQEKRIKKSHFRNCK